MEWVWMFGIARLVSSGCWFGPSHTVSLTRTLSIFDTRVGLTGRPDLASEGWPGISDVVDFSLAVFELPAHARLPRRCD
jgi:hypothetical protein